MIQKKKTGKLLIKGTKVFEKNHKALFKDDTTRFIVNQGGSRSSKTYSILQLLILYAYAKPNSRIAIYRKFKTALTASALPDLLHIMSDMGILRQIDYNKSLGTFKFPGGSSINLFGADDPQQLRGRKYDLVFMNEANELNYEDFLQINMRTRDKLIIDFNPSDPFSWIHDRLLKETNAILIKSTYLDNAFLPAAQVKEIQNLINIDDNYYRIYALGELPIGNEFIFPTLNSTPFPDHLDFSYGMDFGFNDPTTIIKVAVEDGNVYIKEELHESWLNSEQLVNKMNSIGLSTHNFIWADPARPELIDTIYNAGYLIHKASKPPGSVIKGIDLLKRLHIHIDPSSTTTWNEFRNYKYKKLHERVTDVPQGFNDHSIDAVRYAVSEMQQGEVRTSFYNN